MPGYGIVYFTGTFGVTGELTNAADNTGTLTGTLNGNVSIVSSSLHKGLGNDNFAVNNAALQGSIFNGPAQQITIATQIADPNLQLSLSGSIQVSAAGNFGLSVTPNGAEWQADGIQVQLGVSGPVQKSKANPANPPKTAADWYNSAHVLPAASVSLYWATGTTYSTKKSLASSDTLAVDWNEAGGTLRCWQLDSAAGRGDVSALGLQQAGDSQRSHLASVNRVFGTRRASGPSCNDGWDSGGQRDRQPFGAAAFPGDAFLLDRERPGRQGRGQCSTTSLSHPPRRWRPSPPERPLPSLSELP